jgi:hypothetical protein
LERSVQAQEGTVASDRQRKEIRTIGFYVQEELRRSPQKEEIVDRQMFT